jgi:DNA-binding NtrC family response regulator
VAITQSERPQRSDPAQSSDPAITVLVVENEDDIRQVLVELLQDEGYATLQAENLRTAGNLMDASSTPLVLLISDTDAADYEMLEFFTTVQANPATTHAYIYLSSTPKSYKLAALVQILRTLQIPTLGMPVEFDSLLSLVSIAAERVCSGMKEASLQHG